MRLRLGTFASLLGSPQVWALASRSPWLFAGESLHELGLRALSARDFDMAVRLFEGAAERYREDLRTEPLARARVHQLMARALQAGGRASPLSLDVDRALARLERIESPSAPYDLVPAHVMLAGWLDQAEPPRAGEPLQRLAA